MLDGLTQISNILVIGTTNQKDKIDKAMLRPGRLEHALYIGAPDQAGREAIWRIHTKHLVQNKFIKPQILPNLAASTEGFTGAMIQSCVSRAVLIQRRGAI